MSDPGWRRLGPDPAIRAWADHALGPARAALDDPANAHWLRCEGTWFAGVDCLPNDAAGRLPGGPPLPPLAPDPLPLHPAQISAVFPGYPRPKEGESPAAARYRLIRDAAHVDGLIAEGSDKRRHFREPHAWILGLPLTAAPEGASPLVVWEGSHRIMERAFRDRLGPVPPDRRADTDVTDAYHAARREAFETCPRVELPARPGEALLLHRMILHGIAPWRAPDGPPRIVAYFRPQIALEDWLG